MEKHGHKHNPHEEHAEESFVKFFEVLTSKLQAIPIGSPAGSTPAASVKEFEIYSSALQGLSQNNVSKSEGFSMDVKITGPDYKTKRDKLIKDVLSSRPSRP